MTQENEAPDNEGAKNGAPGDDSANGMGAAQPEKP